MMEEQSLSSQEIFIILGMHRSGTSMLAGALSLGDFYFGHNLMKPSNDNVKGYFEHNEIVQIHEEFLNNIGYSWCDIRKIPVSINDDVIRLAQSKLNAVLTSDFKDSNFFAIKDPRHCRLLFLWQPILKQLNIKPKYLFIVRHPVEIAQSLKKRDDFQPEISYLLWLRHVLEPVDYLDESNVSFSSYNELMNNFYDYCARLANEFNLDYNAYFGHISDNPLINEFIDTSLKHHDCNIIQNLSQSPLESKVINLYNAIIQNISQPKYIIELLKSEKNNLAVADSYYGDFASMHQENIIMQKNKYEDLIAKLQEQIDNDTKTIALQEKQYDENMEKLQERIAKDTDTIILQEKQYNTNINMLYERIDKDTATIALQENQYNENINMYAAEIAAKDIKLKDTEAQISLLNHDINKQMHEINLLQEDITNLKQQLNVSEKALTDMATSISWKVTKPLRDMKNRLCKKMGTTSVILDDFFPNILTGFRVAEYNYYLERFPNLQIFSTVPDFDSILCEYLKIYPHFNERINPYNNTSLEDKKFAYINFLNNAHYFLPDLTSKNISFIMTLYPGGGFGLNDPESDEKLKKILLSPLLRGIICTQKITFEYLQKMGVNVPVHFIYGVAINSIYFKQDEILPRATNFNSLRICFAAACYMPEGKNKGYPEFIDAAEQLIELYPTLRFSVVGGFSPESYPLTSKLRSSIAFLGYLQTADLKNFFQSQDIIVSPNRPFLLHNGNFDGFPTATCIEASLCGVAMVCSDELNMNQYYKDSEEIVICNPTSTDIINKVSLLVNNNLHQHF